MADGFSIAALQTQSMQLLRAAQQGDAVLLKRLRGLLPEFVSASDDVMREALTIADAQRALATQAGLRSWEELVRTVEAADPLRVNAALFLKAVRDEQFARAHELLTAYPAISGVNVHTAAATANVDALADWIASDPSSAMRPTEPDGTEPIVYAMQCALHAQLDVSPRARLESVRLLLDAGASANASVPLGDATARIPILYFACVANDEPLTRLLLERGANPTDGESVYHAAQHDHRECLEALREFGAELSGRHGASGNTPLYFLATHRASNPISASVLRGMEWLLAHGADPNVRSFVAGENAGATDEGNSHAGKSYAGEVPLHRVVASGYDASVVALLVAHGANITVRRRDGRTPYALAVRAGNRAAAAYLQQHGAVVDDLAPVDLLLGACAVADEASARAVLTAHPRVLSELTAEDRQALGVAIDERRDASVALMLALGWPLDQDGEWGGTPLHWAAWHGRVALVAQLIAAGAPVNQRDSNYGSSPIAWTAHGSTNANNPRVDDYVSITAALLDAGATRAESFNRWHESAESMAAEPVRALLVARGFCSA